MGKVPKLIAGELDGIDAKLIEVEADINVGLHSFSIVGLADKAVSEAKDRVNSALKNAGIKPPTKENRKITINLAPADIKKAGSRFDLPIALAYLLASEQMQKFNAENKMFLGELSLDGKLRPINGALNFAILAKEKGIEELYLPTENAREAAAIKEIDVYSVESLMQLVEHLEGKSKMKPLPYQEIAPGYPEASVTISEIKGQEAAKRALLVAAAGGHHLLMSGPPGTGKTMLAQALISIVPPPNVEECIEMTKIYSSAGISRGEVMDARPFRSPHSSASLVSLLGGGQNPKPGEVSLAHRGVLFLDEVPEFKSNVIEGLRQPLEDGQIHIARAKRSTTFPARFILVLAKNPCPCGYFEDPEHACKCTANEINRYQKKLSGPLMDRIDIQIEVDRIPIDELRAEKRDEGEDEKFRAKVQKARSRQEERFNKVDGIYANSEMSSKQADEMVELAPEAVKFIEKTLTKKLLSPRGYYRLLKIARTVADLEESDVVDENHIAEAFQYRVRRSER